MKGWYVRSNYRSTLGPFDTKREAEATLKEHLEFCKEQGFVPAWGSAEKGYHVLNPPGYVVLESDPSTRRVLMLGRKT